jgi:rhodanese-related sulfurtransferase
MSPIARAFDAGLRLDLGSSLMSAQTPSADAIPSSASGRAKRRAVVALVIVAGALAAAPWLGDTWDALTAGDERVTLDEARAALDTGSAMLVDLREPDEHADGVAPGAHLLPMRQLASRLGEIPSDASQPVLLICATQGRSRAVAQALRDRGYVNVRYVGGGMDGWARRGWPLVRPGG